MINLKYQLQHGVMHLTYLVEHILYQILSRYYRDYFEYIKKA